jgi:ABC-type nitrate/sulfonate/bicarbonate transport system substrate-binding protein
MTRHNLRVALVVSTFIFFDFLKYAESRPIKVSVPCYCMGYLAFFTAKDRGYYREEDLEVDIIQVSGGLSTNALIAGDLDFDTTGISPVALRGVPIRTVFSANKLLMEWLYARPDIRQIGELKGKKIGINQRGSATEYLLYEILERYGVQNPARESVYIAMGSAPNRFAALVSGVVDAVILPMPQIFYAQKNGYRELLSFSKEKMVSLSGSAVTNERFLKTEPTLIEKFIRGTLKGFLHAKQKAPGTMPIIRDTLKFKDFAVDAYDIQREAMTTDGTVNEEEQRKVLEHLLKAQSVKESPPLNRLFDFSLTRKLYDQLNAQGWRPRT